ncbi:hypothetical protein BN440_0961 [Erwinia amylovora MR1]|nr:hypothetical protein BN440_0961 [Erwinia amylovora MR1]
MMQQEDDEKQELPAAPGFAVHHARCQQIKRWHRASALSDKGQVTATSL